MPSDFPPWPRVYAFFARWRDEGLVAELHESLRVAVRTAEGRSPEPSAGVVDSQSVKADATVTHASPGFDAGKINGRKRHLLTDTVGFLLAVLVTSASSTDRDAARSLLPAAKDHFRQLTRIWADGGYTGHSSTGLPSTSESSSTSSAAATTSKVFRSCPAAGSSKDPSPGSCSADAWSVTTNDAPTPARPSSYGR